MKIYQRHESVSPRRVRFFLKEIDVNDVEFIEIDIRNQENLSSEFETKNITRKVPVLELDSGETISESRAICLYFDALNPEKTLFGKSPLEKAMVENWDRFVEWNFLIPAMQSFRNSTGVYKDREEVCAEWGEVTKRTAFKFLPMLDKRLSESTHIAGEDFSHADITALTALEFAMRALEVEISHYPNITRWHELMKLREGYKA